MDRVLVLILHPSLAEAALDLLLEHPDKVTGYCRSEVSAHGFGATLTGAAEEVAGSSPRTRLEILTRTEHVDALLGMLKDNWPHPGLVYWCVAAENFGVLS